MALEWTWIDLGQLLIATVVGVVVGFTRELRGKPAGTTTITLVTICATLLMQLSFRLPIGVGAVGDPTRLAAAVITGIGFLGAGTIIRRGGHVDGLTSAATIWIMSAVGLSIGAGYYLPALVSLLLVMAGFWINPVIERLIIACRRKFGITIDGTPAEPDDHLFN